MNEINISDYAMFIGYLQNYFKQQFFMSYYYHTLLILYSLINYYSSKGVCQGKTAERGGKDSGECG